MHEHPSQRRFARGIESLDGRSSTTIGGSIILYGLQRRSITDVCPRTVPKTGYDPKSLGGKKLRTLGRRSSPMAPTLCLTVASVTILERGGRAWPPLDLGDVGDATVGDEWSSGLAWALVFVCTSGRRIGNALVVLPVVAVAAVVACSMFGTPPQMEDMDEVDGREDRESGGERGSEDAAVCIVPDSFYREGRQGVSRFVSTVSRIEELNAFKDIYYIVCPS